MGETFMWGGGGGCCKVCERRMTCPPCTCLLTLPVATASVERSFSQMKLIKTQLRNCLSESSVSHLMKIAIESPGTLTDSNLEEVVNIWNRQHRRIPE